MKTRRFLGIVLGLLLCVAPLSAFAITLADLFQPGVFIQVEDKIFFNFTDYSSVAIGNNASPIAPGDIAVVPLVETINFRKEIGLRFQSSFFASGPLSSQDTSFLYSVTTVSGKDVIIDNFLRVGGLGVIGDGFARIGETATDEAGIAVAAKLVGIIPGIGEIDFVQKFFDPQNILIISKDIALAGPGERDAAFISEVDQLFSQVPEPGILILLGIGLSAVGVFSRRVKF